MKTYRFNVISLILLITTLSRTSALTDRARSSSLQHFKGWGQLGNILESEEESMYDGTGHSVASSEDGKIVAVGAPYLKNNAGKVTVFKYDEKELKWKRMGRPLYGLEHKDYFGFSLSMNAKGNALVVSSPTADSGTGIVNVYRWDDLEQSWEQVGGNIEGENEREEFGFAVAMSESGDYIAIGAPYPPEKPGRVEVYRYYDDDWTQVGGSIVGESNEDEAGETIDILEHGKDIYVAVGAPMDLDSEGSATVFKQTGGVGNFQIMDRYVDGDDVGTDFGRSVSLAHDGKNVLLAVGFPGPGIDENSDPLSGVQVYSISPENRWSYHGQMIFPVEKNDDTGERVSLSRDGSTLAITSPEYGTSKGMVRIFTFKGNKYVQMGGDIIGNEYEELGFSMNLSKDGKVVTIGSISGRFAVSYAAGHSTKSASRSAFAIIVLTFFICFITIIGAYAIYRLVQYFRGGASFYSVPSNEIPEPRSTQMMTFPVHTPAKTSSGIESDDDDDEDEDGVSYTDDAEDYETHLRDII